MAPHDADAVPVTGTWFRHVPASIDPTERPQPARANPWQHGRVVDAIYLADSPACVWAEWYRHLTEAGIPPTMGMPRYLWHYQVAPQPVADLSTTDRLARAGVPVPRPGRHGWPVFQTVSDQP